MLTDLTPKVFQRLLVIVALRLCDPSAEVAIEEVGSSV